MTEQMELMRDLETQVFVLKESNKELKDIVDDIPAFMDWLHDNFCPLSDNKWHRIGDELARKLDSKEVRGIYLTETA